MKKNLGQDAIYDARELGVPRMLVLGLQHLFAMFGATVLVPILVTKYGLPLSIQTTLLFAGVKSAASASLVPSPLSLTIPTADGLCAVAMAAISSMQLPPFSHLIWSKYSTQAKI